MNEINNEDYVRYIGYDQPELNNKKGTVKTEPFVIAGVTMVEVLFDFRKNLKYAAPQDLNADHYNVCAVKNLMAA